MSDCGASLSDVATGLSNRAGPQKQTVVVWCGVGEMGGRGGLTSQPQRHEAYE